MRRCIPVLLLLLLFTIAAGTPTACERIDSGAERVVDVIDDVDHVPKPLPVAIGLQAVGLAASIWLAIRNGLKRRSERKAKEYSNKAIGYFGGLYDNLKESDNEDIKKAAATMKVGLKVLIHGSPPEDKALMAHFDKIRKESGAPS